LADCHINLLESFGVKANLVAPIIKDKELFGLLIAHQCSKPRDWQQSEIDLFGQMAMQVGFALDHARLLQRIEAERMRSQLLVDIIRSIRQSLKEEDIIKTTVEEVRKALSTDRVLVYSFYANWFGIIIAESVVPGYPKVLRSKIHDPCFTQGYVEKYQSGRVVAINNIYESSLADCHINLLASFGVKANLVAPIIKDEQLFGLLIAHQCSEPRDWQQSEIDLFAQIAMQVGFTLDHARLLQAYQAAEANSDE
jgi:methyl-accepting chemotaxis protein PixJ